MDIKNANNLDLRLKLLAGDTIYAGNISVDPLTLDEIKEVGYLTYSKYLSILTLNKSDLIQEEVEELKDFSVLDLIILSDNQTLIGALIEALCFFLKEDADQVIVDGGLGIIFDATNLSTDNKRIVNNDNFADVVEIIKYQNCMISSYKVEKKDNPADSKAKEILEKLKKAKEYISKKKASENESDTNIDIVDIISAVSTKSNNYGKHNVWDLTLYQLYDEYKRLEFISGYETSILAMVNGAKIDNLKHWSSKMEDSD